MVLGGVVRCEQQALPYAKCLDAACCITAAAC